MVAKPWNQPSEINVLAYWLAYKLVTSVKTWLN